MSEVIGQKQTMPPVLDGRDVEISRLRAELEQAQTEYTSLYNAGVRRIKERIKHIERLTAALEYYADMDNHTAGEKMVGGDLVQELSNMQWDLGEKARKALKALKDTTL